MKFNINLEDLDKLYNHWDGKVCIFGAGYIGCGWGYELVIESGKKVDFFCDNYIAEGTEIRDGIKIISFDNLCTYKNNLLVFIAASKQNSINIKKQLENNKISEFVVLNEDFLEDLYLYLDFLEENNEEEKYNKYKMLVDDKKFLKKTFLKRMGYELDIENPKTFNEKLQWLKLYDHNPKYTNLVDKYEFKNYIKNTFGEEYVVPLLGVWGSVEDIEWDKLPEKFVLKCTHDSGSYIVCKQKNTFNIEKASELLKKHMNRNYYWSDREWCYKYVKRQIIAEQYMEDEYGELRDYKFYTFGGKVKVMYIVSGRGSRETETVSNFYDCDFNFLDIKQGHPNFVDIPQKPKNFDKMIEFAEIMSKGIPHVRIDFYEVYGRLYIGEFTLYSWGGYESFQPKEWDEILGNYIQLDKGV